MIGEPLRFVAPGAATLESDGPGRYLLWHEYHGSFENRTYRAEPALPAGVKFTITGPDGVALRLEASGAQSWSEGDSHRRAVGQFQALGAGRHTVVVEGSFSPRLIAIAPDFLRKLLAAVAGAILLVLLGAGGGLGIAVYAFGRRADAARRETAAMQGTPPGSIDKEKELREMVTLVYALQALSVVLGVTLIGGVIIDYLKRDEAAGTWLESHIRWQIRTFWWTLVWGVVGFITALILIGFVILFIAAVWFIYRVAKGWVELRAGRPMP